MTDDTSRLIFQRICIVYFDTVRKNNGGNKMKIKKIASLVLAAVLAVTAMTGCGNSSDDPNAAQTSPGYADENGYAEGILGTTMHTEFFDFTVNSAYTCASYEDYIPDDGYQMVIAELTIKNTFSESIPMFDTDFQIQWSDDADDAYEFPITIYLETGRTIGQNMLPDQYSLAVKESRTGILAYEVPVGETQFSISYQTIFDNGGDGNLFFVFFTANAK